MKIKLLTLGVVAGGLLFVPVAYADHHGGKNRGEKMFEKHDTNGDGVISKEEFMAHAEERFGKMDKDGDGKVTKEEAREVREEMKKKWKEHKKSAE